MDKKLGLVKNKYYLNKELSKNFGILKFYISNILESLWKEPEIMFYIITNCKFEDVKYNLSSFIMNNFYSNILSTSNMEVNLLYLLSICLTDEINKLNSIKDINNFLNNTTCGLLLDQLFKQNDIQVYFKSTIFK